MSKKKLASLYSEGLSNMRLEQFSKAINSMKIILDIDPSYTKALFVLGEIFFKASQYQEAIVYYSKILLIEPNNEEAYYFIANILQNTNRDKEAISFYTQAIDINPKYKEAYNNIGLSLTKIGNNEEAILYYDKALKIDSTYLSAYNNIGCSLTKLKNYKAAIHIYKKALDVNPDDINICFNLALILQEEALLEESYSYFNLILKKKSNFTQAAENFITMLIQLDKLDKINSLTNYNSIMIEICTLIAYYIKGSFKEAKILIDNINEKSSIFVSDDHKKFVISYFTFIHNLIVYKLTVEDTLCSKNNTPIYHIGESHCLSFAHQTLDLNNQSYIVKPLIVFGAKAWHLNSTAKNKFKAYFEHHLHSLKKGSFVMLSFGEIDCRIDEGIIKHYLKTGITLENIVEKTVNEYINYTSNILHALELNFIYFGIHAPVIKDNQSKSTKAVLQVKIVKLFNQYLLNLTTKKNLNMINVYTLTVNKIGESNMQYMCDETHLNPSILKLLKFHF